MSSFSAMETRLPLQVVELPRSAWQSTWPDIPSGPTRVGIRLLAASDYTIARANAAEKAHELHPQQGTSVGMQALVDAYNDTLMAFAAARGTCDPTDTAMPWLDAAEDNISEALTPDGIRFLWDAIERTKIANSPLLAPVTVAEAALALPKVDELSSADANTCRKLLAYVCSLVGAHG